jgi:iron complex outermembrane receptor protein
MAIRRNVLIGSVSGLAILCAAAPALAAGTDGEEVVVTGLRQSLEKAIQVKRLSEDQVDAISSTDIGKLPDKNIADALQRLPGVAIQSAASGEGGFDEADRVSIRGTSPSLTQVTIDGHMVSTGDWFILDQYSTVGRSVSFDLLPSELVQQVSVYKTQDASLLEGGVAGAVDIQTRTPLSLGKPWTFEGSLQGAYNSLSKETKPQANAMIGWQSPDETLGVLVQAFAEDRSVERFGQETLGYTTVVGGTAQLPSLIGSTLFKQEKKRDGGFIDLEYRPNNQLDFNLSGFDSKLTASNFNDNYMFWGGHQGAPTTYTVQNNTVTSATFAPGTDGLIVDNIYRPKESSESYYLNLDGKWTVNNSLSFKGQVGLTRGEGKTPNSYSFESDGETGGISIARSGNGWQVSPVAGGGYVGPQNPAGLANDWAWNDVFNSVDKEAYIKVDGQWDANWNIVKDVKFGYRLADHTREVDGWDRGCSLGSNGQCWTGGTLPFSVVNPTAYPSGYSASGLGVPGLLIPIGAQPGNVANILNAITDGVHGPASAIVQAQNYYWMGSFRVHEIDTEGYVMAHLAGEGWRGNVGVRIADTKETPNANVSDPSGTHPGDITTSAYGDYYVTNTTHDYLDVLPSLNLTYDLQKNLLLRFSAAETMSRPDFSALGGTVSLTDLTQTGSGGNSNLKPVKAAVYDVGLEYYYGKASLAAISVFHDDLQSYVTYTTSTQLYRDQLLATCATCLGPYEPYVISSPSNTTGELSGVELQLQQPIAYGFGFQANATYVDGHQAGGAPLVGTSEWTYNLVGYYEDHGLSARLAYTFRSHFYVGLDRSSAENQADYGVLDGSLNYDVTKNVTLTLDATNMTNSLLKYYAANTTQVRAVYDNGTQWFAGFRLKF